MQIMPGHQLASIAAAQQQARGKCPKVHLDYLVTFSTPLTLAEATERITRATTPAAASVEQQAPVYDGVCFRARFWGASFELLPGSPGKLALSLSGRIEGAISVEPDVDSSSFSC